MIKVHYTECEYDTFKAEILDLTTYPPPWQRVWVLTNTESGGYHAHLIGLAHVRILEDRPGPDETFAWVVREYDIDREVVLVAPEDVQMHDDPDRG
jgi:hypothetical protein